MSNKLFVPHGKISGQVKVRELTCVLYVCVMPRYVGCAHEDYAKSSLSVVFKCYL